MRARRVGLLLICSAAIPLAVASTAWACGVLATLKVDKGSTAPGGSLTATGVNYSTAATASPVSIRLDRRSGPELASVAPNAGGRISTSVTLPAGTKPGWHVLLATQTVNGNPKSGTPGRTTVRVQGAARSSSVPAATPWSDSTPTGGSQAAASAGSPTVSTVLGIGLSLVLLGGGLTLLARSRSASRPLLGS